MAPGLVCVSNLWYCMFWAGKRGRRSSAGSLESNVEVSRKYPVQLAILCHPPLVSLLSYFALPSPSCRDTDLALPPCLPLPCMQLLCLEASMPLTACSDPRVGQREGVDFVFSSPLNPCSLWFLSMVNVLAFRSRPGRKRHPPLTHPQLSLLDVLAPLACPYAPPSIASFLEFYWLCVWGRTQWNRLTS